MIDLIQFLLGTLTSPIHSSHTLTHVTSYYPSKHVSTTHMKRRGLTSEGISDICAMCGTKEQ